MNKTKKYKQQGKMSAPQNEGKAELEGHVQRDRPACTGTGRARPCDTMAPLLQFTVTSPLTEEGRREPRPPHDFLCTPPPRGSDDHCAGTGGLLGVLGRCPS